MGRLHVIAVDEILEFGMQEVGPELVLLHLRERLVGRPVLVSHAIDRRHHPCTMPASLAVHVDRLVRRILDQFQELRDFRRRRPLMRCHRDTVELHAEPLDRRRLLRIAILGQIDHRLDAECLEIRIVAAFWLSATIVVRVHTAEVFDLNIRDRRRPAAGLSRTWQCQRQTQQYRSRRDSGDSSIRYQRAPSSGRSELWELPFSRRRPGNIKSNASEDVRPARTLMAVLTEMEAWVVLWRTSQQEKLSRDGSSATSRL